MAKRIVRPRDGELAHRRPEGVAALDVHRRGRLVEHEQRRVADEREREADALRLAAGELLRAPAGDRLDPDQREHLVDVERRRVQRRDHRDQLARGQVLDQHAGLEHRADQCRRSDRVGRRAAEHGHAARVGLGEPEQHVDRRRLAGAVRAEQRDDLAGADRDVDAAHGLDRAVRRLEGLLEAPELDSGRSVRFASCPHHVHERREPVEAAVTDFGMTFVPDAGRARTRCRSRARSGGALEPRAATRLGGVVEDAARNADQQRVVGVLVEARAVGAIPSVAPVRSRLCARPGSPRPWISSREQFDDGVELDQRDRRVAQAAEVLARDADGDRGVLLAAQRRAARERARRSGRPPPCGPGRPRAWR